MICIQRESLRGKKDWAQTNTPFFSSVDASLMMQSLVSVLLDPGMKGNFKATSLFKEIHTVLKLLENILIASPRDKKHWLLKNSPVVTIFIWLWFFSYFLLMLLCAAVLKREVLHVLPVAEKGSICSSLLKKTGWSTLFSRNYFMQNTVSKRVLTEIMKVRTKPVSSLAIMQFFQWAGYFLFPFDYLVSSHNSDSTQTSLNLFSRRSRDQGAEKKQMILTSFKTLNVATHISNSCSIKNLEKTFLFIQIYS